VRARVPWLPEQVQVACDLLGPVEAVAEAFAGATTVVHLAGHNEVIARQEPERSTEETTAMAEAARDAAVRAGVRRIVYVSTVHVYGEHLQPGADITEALPPAPDGPASGCWPPPTRSRRWCCG
jgi:nucleoside-diphosphate-sugar epimerase